jgi:hypothetical protein
MLSGRIRSPEPAAGHTRSKGISGRAGNHRLTIV